MIQRGEINNLIQWKNKVKRKPLILQGARQVGKTWLLNYFGKTYFEDVAYFNFDKQVELKQYFTTTKDAKRIIQNLSLVHGKPILPEKTLIVLDEIQECNDALNCLKYFCEDAPEYAITCAGSLLGVALSKGASFPVGKVEFLTIYPITFSEFLAKSDSQLATYLENYNFTEPIPDLFFSQLLDKFKLYYISGGMPEAVVELLEQGDIQNVQDILQSILNAYSLDFSKHADRKDIHKIGYIWNSLPSQLARENKKFLYQTVKPGARARDYEDALLWLINAGITYRIYCATKPGLPLSAYDDLTAFKLYAMDVGLLRKLSFLDPIAVREGNRLFTEFKGALSENYILQSLMRQFEGTPRYWTSGNTAEIDFLIQHRNEIIPVEVKSDENIRSKSLSVYRRTYEPKLSIRFSLRNIKIEEGLINIPLFMADYTKTIVENYQLHQ